MVDEDEFEENSVKYQYPAELKERARFELEELKRKVASREFPFNSEVIKLLQIQSSLAKVTIKEGITL
ncbi:hypothetical protein J8TS2_19610 [Lederbergia ruris]|uniref:DUF402 domain-containing protein n=1 Tax=Lederbergia ruris TaxID=217495 RepID=A0ABQ4KI85_9BACI|nr:hypothetical protein [Lederbergia ruris]GIN57642.1 hypothetical protein J8TS2_19610 [Lederbergia ruris]